jgi:hypothetical protein
MAAGRREGWTEDDLMAVDSGRTCSTARRRGSCEPVESRGGGRWRALTKELRSAAMLSCDAGVARALGQTVVDGR